jgi:hypothetical protein
MDRVLQLLNIPPTKQENERVKEIYESKRKLNASLEMYAVGVENHRKKALEWIERGHPIAAKNELIQAKLLNRNLVLASDTLLTISKLIIGREGAELIQTTAATMRNVLVLMKSSLDKIDDTNIVKQEQEMQVMFQKVDQLHGKFAMSNHNMIRDTLTPLDNDEINLELEQMIEEVKDRAVLVADNQPLLLEGAGGFQTIQLRRHHTLRTGEEEEDA